MLGISIRTSSKIRSLKQSRTGCYTIIACPFNWTDVVILTSIVVCIYYMVVKWMYQFRCQRPHLTQSSSFFSSGSFFSERVNIITILLLFLPETNAESTLVSLSYFHVRSFVTFLFSSSRLKHSQIYSLKIRGSAFLKCIQLVDRRILVL